MPAAKFSGFAQASRLHGAENSAQRKLAPSSRRPPSAGKTKFRSPLQGGVGFDALPFQHSSTWSEGRNFVPVCKGLRICNPFEGEPCSPLQRGRKFPYPLQGRSNLTPFGRTVPPLAGTPNGSSGGPRKTAPSYSPSGGPCAASGGVGVSLPPLAPGVVCGGSWRGARIVFAFFSPISLIMRFTNAMLS